MGFTKLACFFALLLSGQTPPSDDVYFTNRRSGTIPAEIKPYRLPEIRELQLFESPDRGQTWYQIDKITPDKEGFKYSVPSDGQYWYQFVIINQQSKQDPPDVYKARPALKLQIDTQPPELKITSAQRRGDDLVVSWSVREEHPNPTTMKLEYRTVDSIVWTPIPVTPRQTGEATAKLTTAAALIVRLQFKDMANNFSSVEAQVPGNVAAAGYTPGAVTPQAPERAPTEPTPPPIVPYTPPQPPQTPQVQPTPPALNPPNAGSVLNPPPQPVQVTKPPVPIASTNDSSQGSLVQGMPSMPRQMPPVQFVNDSEIIVEYEVSKLGASGLGVVDVYLTRDLGATWVHYAQDDKPEQGMHEKYYQRTLELRGGQGTYGITLVVKSKAGLGKAPPRPGEVPQMLVEIDTTPPEAQLLPLVPDNQHRDKVILSWAAKDRKLDDRPFTLEWAEVPGGPWQPIATGLPSSSTSFAWQPPPGLPPQVYLRLTVRDAAGNVAVAVTNRPQAVDLNEPEGRVVRVIPANKRQ